MKIKRSLQIVSMLLPTLAAMPAGASSNWANNFTTSSGNYYSATWHTNYGGLDSQCQTVATYNNTSVTAETVTHFSHGTLCWNRADETVASGTYTGFYWQESYVWDSGSYTTSCDSVVKNTANPSAEMADASIGCVQNCCQ